MAFQQNPVPQGQTGPVGMPNMPGVGVNPQNPAVRPPPPGNYQWKGGPPSSGISQPVPGVNGFTGTNGIGSAPETSQFQRPPGPPQNFMNGPTPPTSQFNPNIRPGMPPGPGQYRMQGQPQLVAGPRPTPVITGPPTSIPNQRMGGPPPVAGPLQNFHSPQGPSASTGLPLPYQGHGQYTHQVGMTLTPGITPANSGPPSEQTSRDSSPALNNPNFDALEGQFRPVQPGPPAQPGQPPLGQAAPKSIPLGVQTNSHTPGFPPMPVSSHFSSASMAPGQRPMFTSAPTSMGPQPGFPSTSSPMQRPGLPPQASMANQQPGFQSPPTSIQPRPPSMSTANQQPGFPPQPVSSLANQQPGSIPQANQPQMFPSPPTSSFNQQPRFPPPTSSSNQLPGFPPPPSSTNQQPGFPPSSTNQQPGFPPPPNSSSQQPGFQPPPISANQRPGFPPPPNSVGQQPGFPPRQPMPGFPPQSQPNQVQGFPPPPTSSTGNQSRLPPPPTSNYQQPPGPPAGPFGQNQYPGPGPAGGMRPGKSVEEFVNTYPKPPNAAMNSMTSNFGSMAVQGPKQWNLIQEKRLIPPEGVETPKPTIPHDFKNVNCSPEVFRCTLNAIPQTSALLNKARLPLGILIHPFKDLSQLPVIQSSVIVRCRSCRTYINPFVYFLDSRRWKCNLCYRANDLPDEFSFDPVSKSYGDPQRRPEIKSATIEFIAPSEYMLRPPQPAVYLYLLDVSFNAIETGYLKMYCKTLLDVLDKIPGDSRTQIGFIAYDSSVHFFNLAEGLSQPQMLTVTDVEDIFLPCPDDLLVNLNESKNLVIDLLNQLPSMYEGNMETRSALGAALQAAYKMISGPGGRVTVMQTILPSIGPGALQNREDAGQKGGKDIPNLGPATDFYKKLALDCSAQQVAVDLFLFNGQYADLATIEGISKFSGGAVCYYPSYHSVRTPHLAKQFEADLRRYLTRKIGFEAVMRIRCSKGLSIHTFHGNFFVRSTDLLSLPNINPDAGFGMQMSIEEPLTDMSTMCFQAALLYTSSKGERRIRVHTLCLPITNQLSDIYASADQQAIISLLAKMAVDRSLTASMSDAREAIVNATVDVLNSYGTTLPSSQRSGSICINDQLRLMPLYCLALLKSTGFRLGVATKLDDRVFALQDLKTQPCAQLMLRLYPNLYPIHTIMDVEMAKKGNLEFPKLPVLQLSSANIDRNGAYLLDAGSLIYLYIGSAINEQFCLDILDKPNFAAIQEGGISEFPELENEGSERFQDFVTYLLDSRPDGTAFILAREDGRYRVPFFQYFVEDRTENSMSYYEYLQHIQKQLKS